MSSRTQVQNLFTTIARFRLALIVTLCLVAAAFAVLIAVPHGTAAESPCSPPGVTVATDPAGDQISGTGAVEAQLDVQSLQIAEPFTTASDNSGTFTLKVANLNSPLPPNATWFIRFNALDTMNVSRALFVDMNTNGTNPTVVQFGIGRTDTISGNNIDTTQTALSPQVV